MNNTLKADWHVPEHVHSLITQKNTCISKGSDADNFGFNLATHVGDKLEDVLERRRLLEQHLPLCAAIQWLKQVHGDKVLCLDDLSESDDLEGDACFSFKRHVVCAIATADCLPILLSDSQGHFVAAVHAGWQGLQKGIIGKTLLKIRKHAEEKDIILSDLSAYIGPAISQLNYQVDEAFFERFVSLEKTYQDCFEMDIANKYRADIKAIARLQLNETGVSHIHDSEICTYQSPDFYSYRQSSHLGLAQCGRFVTLAYLSEPGRP